MVRRCERRETTRQTNLFYFGRHAPNPPVYPEKNGYLKKKIKISGRKARQRKSSPFPSLLSSSALLASSWCVSAEFSSARLSGSGRRSPSTSAHRVKLHALTTETRNSAALAFRTKAQRFRQFAKFDVLLQNNK